MDTHHGVTLFCEGYASACRVDGYPLVCIRQLVLQLLRLSVGISKPRHTVFKATVSGSMVHYAKRSACLVALCSKAGNSIGKGKASFVVLCIDGGICRRTAEEICNELSTLIGFPDQSSVFLVNTDTRKRSALAGYGNHTVLAHKNGVSRNGVHAVNLVSLFVLRICIFLAVRSYILAITHGIAECIPALQSSRNIYRYSSNDIAGVLRCFCSFYLNKLCQFVIAICSFIAIGKCHREVREVSVNLNTKAV